MLYYYDKKTLKFEKIKLEFYLILVLLLICIYAIGWQPSTNMFTNSTDCSSEKPQRFSEDALIELLKDCNVKYPHIVLAQAKLESGHFTSTIFKQNNNMFGMRKARQRITTAQTEKSTYAYYRDWKDCVYDYCMYQSSVMCSVSNENEYFAKLGARYAEDSMYVFRLKSLIRSEKLKDIFEE